LVCVADVNAKKYIVYDLSDYYNPYNAGKHNPKEPPEGYAVINGSKGPKGSIFLVICDQTKRCCSRLMQFSSDFKRKLSETKLGFCVRDIRYYPKKKKIIFVTHEDEVRLYICN